MIYFIKIHGHWWRRFLHCSISLSKDTNKIKISNKTKHRHNSHRTNVGSEKFTLKFKAEWPARMEKFQHHDILYIRSSCHHLMYFGHDKKIYILYVIRLRMEHVNEILKGNWGQWLRIIWDSLHSISDKWRYWVTVEGFGNRLVATGRFLIRLQNCLYFSKLRFLYLQGLYSMFQKLCILKIIELVLTSWSEEVSQYFFSDYT